ncbi:hypothetical protein KC660_03680 [Candidatus Dojkabacteria bacterium]|uniref:Uncharacterized protein n=1 Tax=Candidatus Dojkabacteria bacterium TaxID=2099670 RepID=A0A955L3W8_9BACT|nr:hypothetical protein [Candidatus Dojkabacteria bacterium]
MNSLELKGTVLPGGDNRMSFYYYMVLAGDLMTPKGAVGRASWLSRNGHNVVTELDLAINAGANGYQVELGIGFPSTPLGRQLNVLTIRDSIVRSILNRDERDFGTSLSSPISSETPLGTVGFILTGLNVGLFNGDYSRLSQSMKVRIASSFQKEDAVDSRREVLQSCINSLLVITGQIAEIMARQPLHNCNYLINSRQIELSP